MSFSIRPLGAADVEIAQAAISSYIAEFYDADSEVAQRIRQEAEEDLCNFNQIRKRYLQNNGMFYGMTDRGRLIGIGGVKRVSKEVCELRQLVFLRPFRGRGLGEEMAISLIEWARDNNYQTMRLSVSSHQVDALKLFRRLKFVALEQETTQGVRPSELAFELDLHRKSRASS
jgi:GNAT superfamily N-acetyltransferase